MCSLEQYNSSVQFSAVQCSEIQKEEKNNTIQYSKIQYNTIQNNTIQCSAVQLNGDLFSAARGQKADIAFPGKVLEPSYPPLGILGPRTVANCSVV